MRVRDFQQVLGKFTNNEKGTVISDCPIYIETMDGRLEEIRKVLKYVLNPRQDYFLWLVSLIMIYKIFPEFLSTF